MTARDPYKESQLAGVEALLAIARQQAGQTLPLPCCGDHFPDQIALLAAEGPVRGGHRGPRLRVVIAGRLRRTAGKERR